MWPKAFAQLVELAPHISRLLPMADRFFQSKNTAEDATRQTIEALGNRLHMDMEQIARAQAGLEQQTGELSERVDRYAAQVTRLSTEPLERRLTEIEGRQRRQATLMMVVVILLAAAVVLLILLLLRTHQVR